LYEDFYFDELAIVAENDIDRAELDRNNGAQLLALIPRQKTESNITSQKEEHQQPINENEPTKPRVGIVIANTHLFWNYKFYYTRFMQLLQYVRRTTDLAKRLKFMPILCGGKFFRYFSFFLSF
jgi:hypothetical protein